MNRKDSPQSVIDSYRRRQQMAPYFLAGLAVLLVVVGIIILVVWYAGNGKTKVSPMSLFASATPTATETATPTPVTPTATVTSSPTVTVTATATNTATAAGPYEYTVLDGDNCWSIAVDKKVDLAVLLALNGFDGNTCPIAPGGKILIPQAGAQLPTETPRPTALPGAAGEKIEYVVKSGDSIGSIAEKFNTTVSEILKENKIKDANKINIGDKLKITTDTIKPIPTQTPTKTITPGGPTLTSTSAATATTAAATETPKP